jgi:hypothetical protein
LRRRLLEKQDICLADALQQARVLEAAEQQSAEISAEDSRTISHLRHSRQRYSGKCLRCGETGHRTCDAAKGKTCHNCNKVGHLAKACLSQPRRPQPQQIHTITVGRSQSAASQDSGSSVEAFCLTAAHEQPPLTDATINGHQAGVLIDRGSGCNVMSSRTLEDIGIS